jgi:23S rRNA pseudouridine2457 synthase
MKYVCIAFYKPFEVLCQFTDKIGRNTLKNYIPIKYIYPAGRLDYHSEGLLILTNDGLLIQRLTNPRFDHPKTYFVQVEGTIAPSYIEILQKSILLPTLQTKPVQAKIIAEPDLPQRSKPVRNYHPTSWLQITLKEGKKHQIRRLTAALGFPTLRLVRVTIGDLNLTPLNPGEWRYLTQEEVSNLYHPRL